MNLPDSAIWLLRIKRWRRLLFADWSTKAFALFLALVVFVITRDQVLRTFPVQLEVRDDPERVLLSELPRHVEVEVRGAWGRINQLSPGDFGPLVIDLGQVPAGPLHLDASSLTLPNGVALARTQLDYEPVSLVFAPALVREVPISADVQGVVHSAVELVSVQVRPAKWTVRGPRRTIERLSQVSTLPVDVQDVQASFETEVELAAPPAEASYPDAKPGQRPRVTVHVQVRERQSEREIALELADLVLGLVPEADPRQIEPAKVRVLGPVRHIEDLREVAKPLQAEIVSLSRDVAGNKVRVDVRLKWSQDVPSALQHELRFEPQTLHLSVSPGSLIEAPENPSP